MQQKKKLGKTRIAKEQNNKCEKPRAMKRNQQATPVSSKTAEHETQTTGDCRVSHGAERKTQTTGDCRLRPKAQKAFTTVSKLQRTAATTSNADTEFPRARAELPTSKVE